jgi:hypothetical protein
MNKIILATVTAAAAAFIASSAFAGTPGSDSNGQTTKMTGKNGATSYADPVFGDVTCNETQHPKFDTVACAFATPRLDLAGVSGTYGWISDFDHSLPQGTITYTVSLDGTGYTGKATY